MAECLPRTGSLQSDDCGIVFHCHSRAIRCQVNRHFPTPRHIVLQPGGTSGATFCRPDRKGKSLVSTHTGGPTRGCRRRREVFRSICPPFFFIKQLTPILTLNLLLAR